ncbi:hypothetical protein [uncultured Enterovirga sp.]|uniref:hypothetical protein n=1 Tax=uncultured Enterovirga sp. TaxID=2026352 RepID=UPI0035CC04AF
MRAALVPLLREIGDLKRVTSAGRPGSIAERAFRRGWTTLTAGIPAEDVALETTAGCLAATRLGDLDLASLAHLGVSAVEVAAMERAALAEFGNLLSSALADRLAEACGRRASFDDQGPDVSFVARLAAQPRAGATCPGKPRIVLGPAENHAEHCAIVAVYAVLLAEPEADLGTVFLASLAHHLHNAAMPDAGFTGEMLLGQHLEPVIERATEQALAELPTDLRGRVVAARTVLRDADTPEGRAFHAGDVLDRVLEIEQHLARSRVTMDDILGDMALVHDGPVKSFHDRVLAEMGLG